MFPAEWVQHLLRCDTGQFVDGRREHRVVWAMVNTVLLSEAAGKGFAVVANEVKELARETGRATEDIGGKIEAIQSDMRSAVKAIGEITSIIGQINELQNSIASAVEEQTATATEIGRNIADAARGTVSIAENIQGVARASSETSEVADNTRLASESLADMAGKINSLIKRFKY